MRRTNHRAIRAIVALCITLAPAAAWADDLTLNVAGYSGWPDAVEALQRDTSSEGTSLQLWVIDSNGNDVPCGSYSLELDAAGQRAFTVGACDAESNRTTVSLTDRHALFAHDDDVPRPLEIGLSATATITEHGGAVGGVREFAGSEVTCSVAVRPFAYDLEDGPRVYLSPAHYRLRPRSAGIVAQPDDDGWVLRGGRSELSVEYDVVSLRTGIVVLHDRATLQCGASPVGDEPSEDASMSHDRDDHSEDDASQTESSDASDPSTASLHERPTRFRMLAMVNIFTMGTIPRRQSPGGMTGPASPGFGIGPGPAFGGGLMFETSWIDVSAGTHYELGMSDDTNEWEWYGSAAVAHSFGAARFSIGPTLRFWTTQSDTPANNVPWRDALGITARAAFDADGASAGHAVHGSMEPFVAVTVPVVNDGGFAISIGIAPGFGW